MKKINSFLVAFSMTWIGELLLLIYWLCYDRTLSIKPVICDSICGQTLLVVSVVIVATGLYNMLLEYIFTKRI